MYVSNLINFSFIWKC